MDLPLVKFITGGPLVTIETHADCDPRIKLQNFRVRVTQIFVVGVGNQSQFGRVFFHLPCQFVDKFKMTVVITEFRVNLLKFCRTLLALTPMVVILFRKSGKIRTIFHLGDDKTGSRLGLAFEHGDIFIRKMPQYIRMT